MTHEQSALVPTNHKDRPREAKRTNDTTFDRIWKYYHNSKTKVELEEWEHEIRNRWETAWFLLTKSKPQKAVADEVETLFRISKSVAYDDVRNAMKLFGDPRPGQKEAKRAMAETMALRGMEKAETSGDWEMYAVFLQKYIDLNGLKDTGHDMKLEDLIKKFQAVQINIVSTPEALDQIANDMQEELSKNPEYSEAKVVE